MEIKEILEKLPPAPAGVSKWINDEVIENTYIIYNKKSDEAVCTRCGHKFKISSFPNAEHNGKGACPRCHSEAVYKASGKGRNNLTEYSRVLIFTHRGNTVYATLTEVIAKFKPFGKPELLKWMSAAYRFTDKEQEYVKHHPGWYFGSEHWEPVKNIKLPQPPASLNWYSQSRFSKTEIYEENLEKVFQNSCLKYGWQPEIFREYEFDAYDYISYIKLFLKYQSIEILSKSGFFGLVSEKISEYAGSGCVNWRGKSLEKILKLPRRHIKKIREKNMGFSELATFQKLSEKQKMLPWEIVEKLIETLNGRWAEELQKIIDITKWSIWAVRQDAYPGDWLDYIDDCKKLGLDIRKNKILLPDKFYEVHRELSAKIEEKENAEKSAKLKAIAEAFAIPLENEKYILKIASSQTELNQESAALGHCVKRYGDSVARGETCIFFIRKKTEPDVPYYTLEIQPDGEFIQCRGKNNCGMSEEVKAFKDLAVKEFNKMIKTKARKAA